jgi:type IV secretion system protein TrbE
MGAVDRQRAPAVRELSAAGAVAFPRPGLPPGDAERRQQFMREGAHFEGEYALVVQYTPPLRRNTKVADLIYDDDPEAEAVSPASRILEQFKKALGDLEDAIGDAVQLRRMRSYTHTDDFCNLHSRDELLNCLQFCLTHELLALNVPPGAAYLDAILGGRELWPGDTPRLGSEIDGRFIACISIEGFPQESYPGILAALDYLAIPYRWSTRFIYLDQPRRFPSCGSIAASGSSVFAASGRRCSRRPAAL